MKSIRNILCGWILIFLSHGPGLAGDEKPNVLFILADDLGYGDLGCYGHPYARTPNLDKLASEGTRFERFYVTGVTCCPSRTGFMTSRHPASYPKYMSGYGFAGRPTVTQLLQENGYQTAHFGKWHIGPTTSDGIYGIDKVMSDKQRNKDGEDFGRDHLLTSHAIEFLDRYQSKRQSGKTSPFYMNVWCHSTHFPITPPRQYLDRFSDTRFDRSRFPAGLIDKFKHIGKIENIDVDQCLRQYLADVHALDSEVGRLLDKLDELGLRKNTLVVFSSDQGPGPVTVPGKRRENKRGPQQQAERIVMQARMQGAVGPLRGGKHQQLEGGVRVPFIIRWPGKVPANKIDKSSILSALDWLPTLCALSETPCREKEFEGTDVSQTWLGKKTHRRQEPLFWRTSNANATVSVLHENWKLHWTPRGKRQQVELYNLENDPGESHNLADREKDVLDKLMAQAKSWVAGLPAEYEKSKRRGND